MVPVILDVDGTLVDSNFQHALTWHRAFAQHGRDIPAWRTHRSIGMGADMLVPALAGEEWAEEHGDAASDTESSLFRDLIANVRALPGARAFLETLKTRGHPMVLGSSSNQQDLDVYLDLLGARELVDAWTVSDDVEHTKPKPDLIKAALAKLGDPDDAVMIGDSVYDVAGRPRRQAARDRPADRRLRRAGTARRGRGVRLRGPARAARQARRDAARPLARCGWSRGTWRDASARNPSRPPCSPPRARTSSRCRR